MHKGRQYPQIKRRWKLDDCFRPLFIPRQYQFFYEYPYGPVDKGAWRGYSNVPDEDPGTLTHEYLFPLLITDYEEVMAKVWIDGTNDLSKRGIYIDAVGSVYGHRQLHGIWDYTTCDFSGHFGPIEWEWIIGPPGNEVNISLGPPVDWHDYPQDPHWRRSTISNPLHRERRLRHAPGRE